MKGDALECRGHNSEKRALYQTDRRGPRAWYVVVTQCQTEWQTDARDS